MFPIMFLYFVFSTLFSICFLIVPKRSHISFAFFIFKICILCFHFVFHVRMEYFIFSFYCLLLDVCYFTTFCCNLPPPKNDFILIISKPIYCYSNLYLLYNHMFCQMFLYVVPIVHVSLLLFPLTPQFIIFLNQKLIFSIYISEPFVPPKCSPKCFFKNCVFTSFSMLSIIFISYVFFTYVVPKVLMFVSCTHIF